MGNIRNYLQLGLPLGNALLIVALVELTFLFCICIMEFARTLYYNFVHYGVVSDPNIGIELGVALHKTVATFVFLWIGTIFIGSHRMLLGWIVSVFLFAVFYVLIGIAFATRGFYTEAIYSIITLTLMHSYQATIAIWAWQTLRRGEALQPIGKGVLYIWEYFCNDLHNAAKFFIISEIVLDVQFIIIRRFLLYVFAVDLSSEHPAILGEQWVMTAIRLIMDGIGLYLVNKDNRSKVRLWCLGVAIQVLISTALFVILTVSWRGEDLIDTVAVFLFFPIHLLYRCVVLYFCLRYTQVNFSTMVL